MFSFISGWYEETKNKLLDKGKNYALKKFVRSDYLKETTSILPLTLVSITTRNIFNFLVTYRIKTDIYWIDFLISIFVTVGFSLSSPFFYNATNHFIGPDIDKFSKYCIDSFWKEGWVFFEYWKPRILGTLGVAGIAFFYFVEIDSRYCQETIIHLMITSLIVDVINNNWSAEKVNEDIPLVTISNEHFILESYSQADREKTVNKEYKEYPLKIIKEEEEEISNDRLLKILEAHLKITNSPPEISKDPAKISGDPVKVFEDTMKILEYTMINKNPKTSPKTSEDISEKTSEKPSEDISENPPKTFEKNSENSQKTFEDIFKKNSENSQKTSEDISKKKSENPSKTSEDTLKISAEDSWDKCEVMDMEDAIKYLEEENTINQRSFVKNKKKGLISRSLNILKGSLGYKKEATAQTKSTQNIKQNIKQRGNEEDLEGSVIKSCEFEIRDDYEK